MREKSLECIRFLGKIETEEITTVVTSFSMHTIAIILEKLKTLEDYKTFLEVISGINGLLLYTTTPSEEIEICEMSKETGLDFDDALHYYIAKKLNLEIVSFDRHFDKTDIERIEPNDVL